MNTPCIEHKQAGDTNSYGKTIRNGRSRYLHRLAYADKHGLDEATMGGVVMHSCDNRRCVNHEHLSLADHRANWMDCLEKGRDNLPEGVAHHNAKLNDDSVRLIRAAEGTHVAIGKRFGVSRQAVAKIKQRKLWRHVQ